MRLALAQLNSTIGDFEGNLARMRGAVARARAAGAEAVLFPELVTCGYPPLDLLERDRFVSACERSVEALCADAHGIALVVGSVVRAPHRLPRPIANAALVLRDGQVAHVQHKTLLPTYDVFDEARYFAPAREHGVFELAGQRVGLAICEDLWSGEFWGAQRPYHADPVADLVAAGAQLVLALSASPWEQGKGTLREAMLCDAARRHGVAIAFVNMVGGNDELIFDGASFVASRDGEIVQRLAAFEEDLRVVDPLAGEALRSDCAPGSELLQRALVLGIRDYLHKQGFARAVIGLSGGIDSAVTAVLASEALGAENVLGVLMPGPFSSEHSISDAQALAENLGIETRCVRIGSVYDAYRELFGELLGPADDYGVTQENLQARIRGALLMAVSNAENRIVLATGNKSELSVGYTTLYGDLVGGLAVIGDVLKRDVYALARFANREREIVPWNTIEKPPSAELRPDQKDQDSLPPYEVLDEVIHRCVERGLPLDQLDVPGASAQTVQWVLRALDRAEYKRRQAPVVLRVSAKAFGPGRRIPIVQRSGSFG